MSYKLYYLDSLGPPDHLDCLKGIQFMPVQLSEDCQIGDLFWNGDKLIYLSKKGKLSFSLKEQWEYHLRKKYAFTSEPLYRSLGLKGREKNVWDATGGSGKDALLILCFGAKLVIFERNWIIFLLLKDAFFQLKSLEQFPSSRCHLFYGDARDYKEKSNPDIIFYDPMYPEKKKKSALPRKEMQIFSELTKKEEGEEEDFLNWAVSKANERVVVKRPLSGVEIVGIKPIASFKGKTTRYDMYIGKAH